DRRAGRAGAAARRAHCPRSAAAPPSPAPRSPRRGAPPSAEERQARAAPEAPGSGSTAATRRSAPGRPTDRNRPPARVSPEEAPARPRSPRPAREPRLPRSPVRGRAPPRAASPAPAAPPPHPAPPESRTPRAPGCVKAPRSSRLPPGAPRAEATPPPAGQTGRDLPAPPRRFQHWASAHGAVASSSTQALTPLRTELSPQSLHGPGVAQAPLFRIGSRSSALDGWQGRGQWPHVVDAVEAAFERVHDHAHALVVAPHPEFPHLAARSIAGVTRPGRTLEKGHVQRGDLDRRLRLGEEVAHRLVLRIPGRAHRDAAVQVAGQRDEHVLRRGIERDFQVVRHHVVPAPPIRRRHGCIEESQAYWLPRLAQGAEVFDQGEHRLAPPAVLIGIRPERASKEG